jgi:tetratricopeptide (TPR) repeat protein
MEQAIRLDPENSFSLLALALKARIEGRPAQGLRALRDLEARREKGGVPDGEMTYKLAQLYAQLGDQKAALRMLRKATDQGFYCYPYISQDPLMDPIRSSVEYHSLLAAVKDKHESLNQKLGQKKVM